MPKKRKSKHAQDSRVARFPIINGDQITLGDISNSSGVAVGHKAHATVIQDGSTADEIALVFKTIHKQLVVMPDGPEKSVAQNTVTALESEARKGKEASETSVKKWLGFLAETAPDVWEVAVDMFTNPIKGVSTVFKKIADKAKSERDKTNNGEK